MPPFATVRGGALSLRRPANSPKPRVIVGIEPILAGRDPACGLVVPDARVSAVHAELGVTGEGVRVRDLGSRNGIWIGDVRVREAYLTRAASVWLGPCEVVFEPEPPQRLRLSDATRFGRLYGASQAMRTLFERISRVAPTDLTVLIQGETGTGKELVAEAIHGASARSKGPFVVLDCGAIPPGLAEAVIFGHERGAYTGAVERRASPFVEASGGTLFLDELGELPLDLQPKLLRVLAERRIKPVGGASYVPVDVRVVAATRRDLVRLVNEESFRTDLYFRVAQVRIELPPLRDRLGDVPGLVRHILAELGASAPAERVSTAQLERLMRYEWPGNVRQLASAVAAAYALAEPDATIDIASEIASEAAPLGGAFDPARGTVDFHKARRDVLDRFEREFFGHLLRLAGGNITEMGRTAGLERANVRKYLKRHGLLPRRR